MSCQSWRKSASERPELWARSGGGINEIDAIEDGFEWEEEPTEDDVGRQDEKLLRRQRDFRAAAERVAAAWAEIPAVEKVVLFGSVAVPLWKENPRFPQYRRARIALWHECRDLDLGALCHFSQCPKGKDECLVAGCGRPPFLRQHGSFALAPGVT